MNFDYSHDRGTQLARRLSDEFIYQQIRYLDPDLHRSQTGKARSPKGALGTVSMLFVLLYLAVIAGLIVFLALFK